jgi:hypothetical protein
MSGLILPPFLMALRRRLLAGRSQHHALMVIAAKSTATPPTAMTATTAVDRPPMCAVMVIDSNVRNRDVFGGFRLASPARLFSYGYGARRWLDITVYRKASVCLYSECNVVRRKDFRQALTHHNTKTAQRAPYRTHTKERGIHRGFPSEIPLRGAHIFAQNSAVAFPHGHALQSFGGSPRAWYQGACRLSDR